MNRSQFLAMFAAAILILLSGVGHGFMTDRWSEPEALQRAADSISRCLPEKVGGRVGQAAELDPMIKAAAGITNGMIRRYVHPTRGDTISVILVCGRPGPIATHPPEICLAGAGYEMASDSRKVIIRHSSPERTAEFSTADFRKVGPSGPSALRVFWSWGADGAWSTPKFPRWTFAPEPVLFKVYVIAEVPGTTTNDETDAYLSFINDLMPSLQSCF